jgi:hypothetical protein
MLPEGISMKQAVSQVIETIEPGFVFDSHFVIAQLIKHHSDAYIHFAGPNQTTAQMHGIIAQIIGNLAFVKKLRQESWSDTIHGTSGRCALWERIPCAISSKTNTESC